MKVHPTTNKRNIATSLHRGAGTASSSAATTNPKKLKRLPHVFAKVLELPFHSDADVLVQETPESFRFSIKREDMYDDFEAQVVEIFPGATKILVRETNPEDDDHDGSWADGFDTWRFRLPAMTRPEMVSTRLSG
ncbi:hypothetical protein Tsubulata_048742 [Turnera subulata]|uniref:Uncharacterized protein n=1 Tax=Turnera subulata TaxID=218843 RepID=A0A9Q0J978_9ROSI|nr:hypothetical protein Tsubulata_048742 [Turnera subulata]